ncbi:hypothetical protein [Cellulomonas denverensis]|uniref:hypothetical protein n=1 Tax=Cellulomonas denverensis TaxID=264297 RepID=UPI0035F000E5
MSAPTKRSTPGNLEPGTVALAGLVAFFAVPACTAWGALRVDDALHDRNSTTGRNPLSVLAGLARGELAWSTTATISALLLLALVGGLLWSAAAGYRRLVPAKLPVDRAAVHMGRGKQVDALREAHVRRTARRLGCPDAIGLKVGTAVLGGYSVWVGWEDVSIDIWGPRSGKTTSRAIPSILDAPARSWRRRTSATWSTPPATFAPHGRGRRCGCSTRRPSSTNRSPGGGTRCGSSPTR